MRLVRLFLSETYTRRWLLLACLVLQGVGTMVVIAMVGDTYHEVEFTLEFRQLGYFLLGAVVIVFASYQYRRLTIAGSEELIQKIRDRYAEMLPQSDLQVMEGGGSTHTYDVIARSTTTLTEATVQIVGGTQAATTFVAMSLYILYLSPLAFAVLLVIVATMYLHHRYTRPSNAAHFKTASEAEARFFGLLSHVVWGFKEIKMNSQRAEEIEREFLFPASTYARDAKIHANNQVLKGQLIGDALFYVLWATVVFVIPQYLDDRDKIFSLVLSVTYMLQAFGGVVQTYPALSHVDSAFAQLDELEARLRHDHREPDQKSGLIDPAFDSIQMSALIFDHRTESGQTVFTLGPCDLKLRAGQVVVFRGGNGSGKSTLLKTLAFLYRPRSGAILWDGVPVGRNNVADYRNLFATVFWDFHLFDRLYGLPQRTDAEVNGLLEEFGINHLTRYENGAFARTDLSTGQRKRLALAVAILERRPILIFDEVAAEQDAEFRDSFYRKVVPRLKAEGHTVLIASHDDRYFDVADQIILMRDGRIVEEDT